MSSEIIIALIGLFGVVIGVVPTYLLMWQRNRVELEKLKAEAIVRTIEAEERQRIRDEFSCAESIEAKKKELMKIAILNKEPYMIEVDEVLMARNNSGISNPGWMARAKNLEYKLDEYQRTLDVTINTAWRRWDLIPIADAKNKVNEWAFLAELTSVLESKQSLASTKFSGIEKCTTLAEINNIVNEIENLAREASDTFFELMDEYQYCCQRALLLQELRNILSTNQVEFIDIDAILEYARKLNAFSECNKYMEGILLLMMQKCDRTSSGKIVISEQHQRILNQHTNTKTR